MATVPGRGDVIRHAKKVRVEHGGEIVKKYEAGIPSDDIAAEYGISRMSVLRCVRSNDGTVRKRGFGARNNEGPNNVGWKGGRYTKTDGYVYVWIPQSHPFAEMRQRKGYVPEHRLIVAQQIGRSLETHETVHHIDGNPSNNDPSNLQLRFGKHGKGVAYRCLECGSQNVAPDELGG